MPELVACPSCGLKVQMAEGLIGQPVRCIGCQHRFLAEPAPEVPVAQQESPLARWGTNPRRPPPDPEDEDSRPFCPACDRAVTWEDVVCPHCGEELESEEPIRRRRPLPRDVRRDQVPHRARTISLLGNLSMVVGALSLCTLGIGALVSIPAGITAWVMASNDLEKMRTGLMDSQGRTQTETGRTGAIVGVVLSLIFASFFALLYLERF
jgi:hypothetical protein